MNSSKGNQYKYQRDGKWYKKDSLGYEAAAEVVTSYILKHSNVMHYVDYYPYKDSQDNVYAVSEDFNIPDKILVTLYRQYKASTGKDINKDFSRLSTEERILKSVEIINAKYYGEYLTAMLELDSLILNEDRHFNNVIYFKDKLSDTCSLAPLFDNGAAFLSDITIDYPIGERVSALVSKVKSKPFNVSFKKQMETCEALYGQQLQILKSIDLEPVLNMLSNYYNDNILSRIETVFRIQRNKYPHLFVDSIGIDDSIISCIPSATIDRYEGDILNFCHEHKELFSWKI